MSRVYTYSMLQVWRSVQQAADLKATEIKRAIEFRRKN